LIPHSRPWVTVADTTAITAVLTQEMIAQGEATARFERAITDWVGGCEGIATASGSAALVLALMGLGISPRDEIILPTYVCRSLLEAILAVDASPVLCDTGDDWLMTPESVERHITETTRAIVIPHIYGLFANVERFRCFDLPLIEDCAQAIGHRRQACIAGDVAIFSFHPTKCLTTGEGGLCVTSDPMTAERMRAMRDGATGTPQARFLSPMSDIAATLGLAQLARYEDGLVRRKNLARRYFEALRDIKGIDTREDLSHIGMHFRFPVLIPGGLESVQNAFESRGIAVRRGVDRLLHREAGLDETPFPHAISLFESTVSLPLYPALSNSDHEHCVESAVEIFSGLN
jgi:perosamine synthetase